MRLAGTGASRPSPLNGAAATQRRREATMLRIFAGHDPLQPVSTTVLVHSIISRASKPVCVTPLSLKTLPIKRRGLTEFTYSRFLVPYLCDYQGWSLFLDTDMLVLEDIAKLFELADDRHTIQLVKNKLRLDLILFNNAKCRELRPAVIDDMSRDPFGLWWASSVGALPEEWNHCVGCDDPRNDAKLVHFTQGVPFFLDTEGTEYVDEWRSELEASVHAESWESLMANSVHAKQAATFREVTDVRARLAVA
jgi:lipopolysaccharide biosynthesis glycosyltransferase